MGLGEVLIAAGIFVVIFGVLLYWFTTHAAGQDFDPCMVDNEMFQRICDKIEIEKIYEQLLNRTKEWNELHK